MTLKLGETIRNQENVCPYCGTKHDALTGLTDHGEENAEHRGPKPGSFTVCFNCTEIAVFDEDMQQRKVTEEDYASLDDDQMMELQKARAVLIMSQQERQAQIAKMVSDALGIPKRKIKFGGIVIVRPNSGD